MTILDHLLEACATGKPCATRRIAAISPAGLGQLTRDGLWHEAAQRIARLDAVHPAAQERFLETYCKVPFRKYVTDDDLWFAMARKAMPSYAGPAVRLYRGQVRQDKPGMSWTRSPHIALKFAVFGTDNIDPVRLAIDGVPAARAAHCRPHAVVLSAIVPETNIICAPCLLGKDEGEYLIDPRGIAYECESATDAAAWIGPRTRAALAACQAQRGPPVS
jgi:hypothetical protein